MRKIAEIRADLDAAQKGLAGVDLKDQAAVDAAEANVKSLMKELELAELNERAAKQVASKAFETPEQKELKRFSLAKFIREAAAGRGLTGFEAEMNEEAEKEMRAAGQTLAGVGIPTILLGLRTFDNNNITTATEGKVGTTYINTTDGGIFRCVAIDNSGDTPSYTWSEVTVS